MVCNAYAHVHGLLYHKAMAQLQLLLTNDFTKTSLFQGKFSLICMLQTFQGL